MSEPELIDIWVYDAPPNARVPGYQTVASSPGLTGADVRNLERRSGVGAAIQARPIGFAWSFRRFDDHRYVLSMRQSVGLRGDGPNHRIACVALILTDVLAERLGFNPRVLLASGVELEPVSGSGASGPRITGQELLRHAHISESATRFRPCVPPQVTDEGVRRWQLGEWWKTDPAATATIAERLVRAASASMTVLLGDSDGDAMFAAYAPLLFPPSDRRSLAYDTYACAEFPLEPGFAWCPSTHTKAVAKSAGPACRQLAEIGDDPLGDDMREWLAESFGLARWPRPGESAERVKRSGARLYSIVRAADATVSMLPDSVRRDASRSLIRCHALLDAAASASGGIPVVREAFAAAWNAETDGAFGWINAAWPRLTEVLVLAHTTSAANRGAESTSGDASMPNWGPAVGGADASRIAQHVDLGLLQNFIASLETRIRQSADLERLALLEILFEFEPILARRGGHSSFNAVTPVFVEVVAPDRFAEWGETLTSADPAGLRRVAAMALGRLVATGHEAAFRYVDALGQWERKVSGFIDRVFPRLRRDACDAATAVAEALQLADILTPRDNWHRRFRDLVAAHAPIETQIEDLESAFVSGDSVVELLKRLHADGRWLAHRRVHEFAAAAANGFFGDRTTYANPAEAAMLLIRLADRMLEFDAAAATEVILGLAHRYWTRQAERSLDIEDAIRTAVVGHRLSTFVMESDLRTWLQGRHPEDDRVRPALDHLDRLIEGLTTVERSRLRSVAATSGNVTGFGALLATRILRESFCVGRSPREEREKVRLLANRLQGRAFCAFVEDWLARDDADPNRLPWVCETIAGSSTLGDDHVWRLVRGRCRTVFGADARDWAHFAPLLISRARHVAFRNGALDEPGARSLAEDVALWRRRSLRTNDSVGAIHVKKTLRDVIDQLCRGLSGTSAGIAGRNLRTMLSKILEVDLIGAVAFRGLAVDVAATRFRDRSWPSETFDLFIRDLVAAEQVGVNQKGSSGRATEIREAVDALVNSPEVQGHPPALGRVAIQIVLHAPWSAARRMSTRWEAIDPAVRRAAIKSAGETIVRALDVAAKRPANMMDGIGASHLSRGETHIETIADLPLERARLDYMRRELFATGETP